MSRGTIVLDRIAGPLGRIRLATGTHDKDEAKKFNGLVTDLVSMCDWAVLKRLQSHELTIRQLYFAKLRGEPLPKAEDVTPVWPLMEKWLHELDAAPSTKETYGGLISRLSQAHPGATIAKLPAVLALEKVTHTAAGTKSTYNDRRQICLQFLRDHLGPRHEMVYAVQDVKPLKLKRRPRNPQTPDQIRALVARLPKEASNIWGLCLTGMRKSEWFEAGWTVQPDRVVIPGTKTDNAPRIIPRAYNVARPAGTYYRLIQALHKVTKGEVTPHDLRATFMCWLEDAGIPRSRRQIYLGHVVRDVTELYERRRNVEPWLTEDAAKLRTFLGDNPMAVGLAVVG